MAFRQESVSLVTYTTMESSVQGGQQFFLHLLCCSPLPFLSPLAQKGVLSQRVQNKAIVCLLYKMLADLNC